jgi:RNA polymerase sigma factor (sigma-70 family)
LQAIELFIFNICKLMQPFASGNVIDSDFGQALNTQTDIKLKSIIERCKQGDRKAQYELYKMYSKAMYNVSLRIVKKEDDAHDVLQEAFISAFKHLNTWKGDSTFGAWLKRIVVNRAVNELRKQRYIVEPIEDVDLADEAGDVEMDEQNLQVQSIKLALETLPEGYRMVLTLYLFEGYDHKEIAEILGITESTSKSQYMRAKQRLLKIIEQRRESWRMN